MSHYVVADRLASLEILHLSPRTLDAAIAYCRAAGMTGPTPFDVGKRYFRIKRCHAHVVASSDAEALAIYERFRNATYRRYGASRES